MREPPHVLDSLSVAVRSAGFWFAVMRHSVPVIGVAVFGWSAVSVAVIFLLESWIFLTNRLTIEVTFDRKYAGHELPVTVGQAISQTAKMWLLAAPVLAFMLFAFGGFVLLVAFPPGDWAEFSSDGWRRMSFRVSVVLILLDAIVDAVRFQRRLLTRSAAERVSDDRSVRVMFYRVVALLGGCVMLGLAAKVGLGGPLLVLAISLILVSFEALPQHMLGFFDDQFHGGSPDSPPTK